MHIVCGGQSRISKLRRRSDSALSVLERLLCESKRLFGRLDGFKASSAEKRNTEGRLCRPLIFVRSKQKFAALASASAQKRRRPRLLYRFDLKNHVSHAGFPLLKYPFKISDTTFCRGRPRQSRNSILKGYFKRGGYMVKNLEIQTKPPKKNKT